MDKHSNSREKVTKGIIVCVMAILLLVLGWQFWTIRSQGYEITTLRATCISDKDDLNEMRRKISELTLEQKMEVIRVQNKKKDHEQYKKMVDEEIDLFGDSIMEVNHVLDENDDFVRSLKTAINEDSYYTREGNFEYYRKAVIYSDKWIISYRLDYDNAWGKGATHAEVGTLNRNPFLKSDNQGTVSNSSFLSRRLRLSDIVSKDDIPKMTELLVEAFKKELDKKGFEYIWPVKPTENFYYADDGLHFVYDMYEIHCGAAGAFDLCIEWPLPESVVSGYRGVGTGELPEEWPIPAKIAPRPVKKDWKPLPQNVQFELIKDQWDMERALSIYSGGRLSFSHDANHEYLGFMKYDGDDGEDSFKTVFCRFEEPFDYHDYLLDMKGDGDHRYLILGDLCSGTAATMEGYLLDAKDDFSLVGRIPVREFISYPKHNPDLVFDFFERIHYFGSLDGGYIHIKMKIQKGEKPQYVETEKRPFSIKEFEKELLDDRIVKSLSSKDDTGFHFDTPIPYCREVAFHKLCCELFSNGELDKLHDYAKQMGCSEVEIREIESECMEYIHGCELYKYVHDNFKNVWGK